MLNNSVIICYDFNKALVRVTDNNNIANFANFMYFITLFLTIYNPTCVTRYLASLLNNFF